ncbi:MAG: FxsA family protein, partial [Spirochaetaceae bacterium]
MFFKLLGAFTIIPIIELYILIQLGSVIGALPTVLLVILTGAAGAALAKAQGVSVWSRIQRELNAGRFPGNDLIDGLLLLLAGVTLLTPGLLTDVAGFLLLVPVTRYPVREWLKRRFRRTL